MKNRQFSRQLKAKKDKEAKEIWAGISPSAVKCKTCAFAYSEDTRWGGPENSNCEIYEDEEKPVDVLWRGANCKYYLEVI